MYKQTKTGATNTGSKPKTFLIADGNQNALDVFNTSQKVKKSQTICGLCAPLPYKSLEAVKPCAGCKERTAQLDVKLFEHSKSSRRNCLAHYAEIDSVVSETSKRIGRKVRGKNVGEVK